MEKQIIVLRGRHEDSQLTCKEGTVQITESGNVVIDYEELLEQIKCFTEEKYNIRLDEG